MYKTPKVDFEIEQRKVFFFLSLISFPKTFGSLNPKTHSYREVTKFSDLCSSSVGFQFAISVSFLWLLSEPLLKLLSVPFSYLFSFPSIRPRVCPSDIKTCIIFCVLQPALIIIESEQRILLKFKFTIQMCNRMTNFTIEKSCQKNTYSMKEDYKEGKTKLVNKVVQVKTFKRLWFQKCLLF